MQATLLSLKDKQALKTICQPNHNSKDSTAPTLGFTHMVFTHTIIGLELSSQFLYSLPESHDKSVGKYIEQIGHNRIKFIRDQYLLKRINCRYHKNFFKTLKRLLNCALVGQSHTSCLKAPCECSKHEEYLSYFPCTIVLKKR